MPDKETIKVGIIAAPGRAADITEKLIDHFENHFLENIDDKINWKVEQLIDPLTGAAESAQDILYNAAYIKRKKEWEYAICLTDLPIFYNKDVVAGDISFNYKVAQISIPAYGWIPMRRRIEKTIIQLVAELHENYTAEHPKLYNSRNKEKQAETSITHLFKRQFPIMPIRRQENPDIPFKSHLKYVNDELRGHEQEKRDHSDNNEEDDGNIADDNNIDVRYIVFPRINGRLRLILGMTFSNNPMKIMSSFKSVITIAFTTGVFGLIFPTIWNMGQILSVYRLSGIMFAAIFGLVAWIITAHNLWERPSNRNDPKIRSLYNLATTSTLLIDVITYYVFMFILFLTVCLIFIPVDYFQSMINDYDDAGSTFVNYMRAAWASASISIIVSAIGAGLEDEELVRNITYGYRQKRRYEEMNHHENS